MKPTIAVGEPAAARHVRQPRRHEREEAVGEEEEPKRGLEHAGVAARQERDAERDAERAADEEGPEPPGLERPAHEPDREEVQADPAREHEHRRLQRRQRVQPHRGCDEREGKAGAADRKRAEKGAEPEDAEELEREQPERCRHSAASRSSVSPGDTRVKCTGSVVIARPPSASRATV